MPRRKTSTPQKVKDDGMRGVRRNYRKRGFSKTATNIMLSSWRDNTKKSYRPYIKKWQIYANKRGIDPVHPHVSGPINFMSKLVSRGISYSSLCITRSALSCFIDTNYTNGITFGSLPEVKRLMKGAFEINPTYPESSKATTWDPNIVLDYLKNLYPNRQLSLKELTLKLVTLLALCTGQRLQTIQKLNTDNMTLKENKCSFIITEKLKHTRKGHHLKPIELSAYPHDKDLCVIHTLHEYIEKTTVHRKNTQLLISFQKPHNSVGKDTIARWIKSTLESAGIDTTVYTAHSTRAASTSAVNKTALSINTILNAAGWTRESTFSRFYKKQTVENFGQTLMSSYLSKI